jgi:6-hydroxycyclohex-1-ene-1-carbonyl-CoA dehydrogenase
MRAEVKPGDLTIIIGATGGLGVYATQIVSALGAKEVIGIARNPEKLSRALDFGATHVISSLNKSPKDIRDAFRNYCKEKGVPANYGWKIFEWTGTGDGQAIALELLSFIGKLVICGFGMQKNEYSLSRLMAFDADILGSWGCLPKYYPQVLKMVLEGKVKIEPFIDTRPMSQIKQAFDEAHATSLTKRIVLTPDF